MKLLNKIIPCVGLVGVAAAATPLMVGCSSNVPSYEYDIKKVVFDPEHVEWIVKDLGEMKQSDATDIYFDDISKNPQIVASDLLIPVNWAALVQPLSIEDYNIYNCKFRIGTINKQEHRLTYELVIHCEKEHVGLNEKPEIVDVSVCFYNFQYTVQYSPKEGQESKWTIIPSFRIGEDKEIWHDTLKQDTKWSIQTKYTRAGCVWSGNYDYNFDSYIFESILEFMGDDYNMSLFGPSEYFKKIALKN